MHDSALDTHAHHHEADSTDVFGFWLYIMTDCILFGCLFATYLVLSSPGAPGPELKTYLDLRDILIETFLLLASNFTFCLASLNLYQNKLLKVQAWLGVTFLLGGSFVVMEVQEFIRLAGEGFRWDVSGAASAFFTLVGTHGLHVSVGLLWILLTIIQLPILKITHITKRRMTYLGLFWNFLDIVWIFVFTIVYLMGAM
jgi:cytochrome o ubiquinol oxidase subunit 3